MSMTCSVCRHPERDEIDRAIVEGRLSARAIAAQFGSSKSSVLRHKRKCLWQALVRAEQSRAASRGAALLETLEGVESRALALFDRAEESLLAAMREQDPKIAAASIRAAAAALRELRECVKLRGQASGELQPASAKNGGPANVSVIVMPAIPPPIDGKAPQGQRVAEGREWEDAAIRPLQLS